MNLRPCTSFLLIIFAFFSGPVIAKDHYAAFNYQRSNGFPGNKVYCLFQDSRGYIWMGTENGLVRFNGYEFKTYTINDGLPDNEVLGINEDKTGRLWILTFSNEICYLWNGTISNPGNDSVLNKLKFSNNIYGVLFDKWSNTFVLSQNEFYRIDSLNRVTRISHFGKDSIVFVVMARENENGTVNFLYNHKYYQYNKDHFELLASLPEHPMFTYNHVGFEALSLEEFTWTSLPDFIERYQSSKTPYWTLDELRTFKFFKKISASLLVLAAGDGACFKDIKTGKPVAAFLKGHVVSPCIFARDSSLWFGTLGEGVYHYSSSFIQSFGNDKKPVRFVKKSGKGIHYILNSSTLVEVGYNAQQKPVLTGKRILKKEFTPCFYADKDQSGDWIICARDYILRLDGHSLMCKDQYATGINKAVLDDGNGFLLVGTAYALYHIFQKAFRMTDVLHLKRVTALAKIKDLICIGTLHGLFLYQRKSKVAAGKRLVPVWDHHINALFTEADIILWMADNKGTLVRVGDDHIPKLFNRNTGLRCNSISVLKATGRFLWAGTDNGLYAIERTTPFKIIRHLSVADGLNSNQVNYIEADSSYVWVGTDKGLNYFDERKIIPVRTAPAFLITSIQNGSETMHPDPQLIKLTNKTLTIDFDVIDHSGITQPGYAYRINNNEWIESRNNNLYFPTLPYGQFTLSIKAVSANWDAPKILTLNFYRPYPYYLKWWFVAIIIVLLLGIAIMAVRTFLERTRRKDKEKLQVQQNLLQLEQMALQGQMNPHFIFNCIAAIRQYYNKGDTLKADRFVDTFSALIRTTFEVAGQTFTSLDKELDYLDKYLTIEQERFDQSFHYSINKKISMAETRIPVPVMLLQPLVENAVRHGVRHLPNGVGQIDIDVIQQTDEIHITIADNGRGRDATLKMKQAFPGHVPVTSTSVNNKRVRLLNKLFGNRFTMHAEDIRGGDGQVGGTRIFISYPLNIYAFEP